MTGSARFPATISCDALTGFQDPLIEGSYPSHPIRPGCLPRELRVPLRSPAAAPNIPYHGELPWIEGRQHGLGLGDDNTDSFGIRINDFLGESLPMLL